jgi:type VI secretion system secreted protein Hcp
MASQTADIFVKITGIPGETTDHVHTNEIQIKDFSLGAAQATSESFGTGLGVGKVQLEPVKFTKTMDKASSRLFQAMCTGEHLAEAKFSFRKAGGQEENPPDFLVITCKDCMAKRTSFTDHGANDLGTESWTLAYTSIEFSYRPQDKDGKLLGPVIKGYDQKQNKAF